MCAQLCRAPSPAVARVPAAPHSADSLCNGGAPIAHFILATTDSSELSSHLERPGCHLGWAQS